MYIPRYALPRPDRLHDHSIIHTDCLVIGSGIAGLYSAIAASEHMNVMLMTKDTLRASNTQYAQGGIAAVLAEDDSPSQHKADTIMAGAGLCDEDIVDLLVRESPRMIDQLMSYGVLFDQQHGRLALTKEGAHTHRRILHCNGDATGAEIVRGLTETIQNNERITIHEHTYAIDLLTQGHRCYGVIAQEKTGRDIVVLAQSVVLATGGIGQLYSYTTNPFIATGDGIGMALRAGAELQDMEFIQFHPTVFKNKQGQGFLISEALRGEGAVLRNIRGERFMPQYHDLAELAPRDVVSRAIFNEMMATEQPSVYLDITQHTEAWLSQRFPTINAVCREHGINMAKNLVPVAPAAHYAMGGVKTNRHGETNIDGLYACGETACTGLHGANRLASNSLSESVVMADRIVKKIVEKNDTQVGSPPHLETLLYGADSAKIYASSDNKFRSDKIQNIRHTLQTLMTSHVGVERQASELQEMRTHIEASMHDVYQHLDSRVERREESSQQIIELTNLLSCALLCTVSAQSREESRGGHYRRDFPHTREEWRTHLIYQRDEHGYLKGRRKNVSSKMEKTY
ncbi:L-aspartate oxidase [Caldalkalibacillus salinus]|uniref:L-aspartate oxidase n=1 Tax=Caldalkalibacillus salinus TaxID=2803787 RepID=UPI001921AFA9|nr:L-aspartate oxidase [Caldalkalibacillus salinus]